MTLDGKQPLLANAKVGDIVIFRGGAFGVVANIKPSRYYPISIYIFDSSWWDGCPVDVDTLTVMMDGVFINDNKIRPDDVVELIQNNSSIMPVRDV